MTPEQLALIDRLLERIERIVDLEYCSRFNKAEVSNTEWRIYDSDGVTVKYAYSVTDDGFLIKRGPKE